MVRNRTLLYVAAIALAFGSSNAGAQRIPIDTNPDPDEQRNIATLRTYPIHAGNKTYKIQLIALDTRGEPKEATVQLKRLVEVDGAKYIFGPFLSNVFLAVRPYAGEFNVFRGDLVHDLRRHRPGLPGLARDEGLAGDALDIEIDIDGVRIARKHISWYTKGLNGSAEFRNMVNQEDDPMIVKAKLREFYAPWLSQKAA